MANGKFQFGTTNWNGEIIWRSTPIPDQNASTVVVDVHMWGWSAWGNEPFWGNLWIGQKMTSYTFQELGDYQWVGGMREVVPHDSNGDASVTISTTCWPPEGNSQIGDILEGEQTVTLDHIEQAGPSEMTFSQDPVQMGKKLMISLQRDQPDCTHALSYRFGGAEGVIAEKAEGSWEWTVPDLAGQCTDALSGSCTITCKTYRGGKFLGTTEKALTLLVQDPAVPCLPQATLGMAARISCPAGSAAFTLELSLILKEQEYSLGTASGGALLWTPGYELGKVMPAQREMSGLIRCRTRNGSALVGTKDSAVLLTVPENEVTRPKIRNLVLTPILHGLEARFGWLRGKTGLQVRVEAVSDCSEIGSYTLQAGRQRAEGNPAEISVLEDGGKVKILAAVRDLRGFEAAKTEEIYVTPYEKPRVVPLTGKKEVVCQRAEKDGTLSRNGTWLAVQTGIQYTPIAPEGKDLNSCILRYRWKMGEGSYGPWQTLLESGQKEIRTLLPEIVTSTKHTYLVELSALDGLGQESRMEFPIFSEAISMVLYDGTDGISFGKFPEAPHVVDLASHMTLLVRGNLELRGERWQELGLAPGIRTPIASVGRVEGAQLRLSGGNHVYLAFCCGMPGTGQAVNREPVPEALRPPRPVWGVCPSEGGLVTVRLDHDGFLRVQPLTGSQTPGWIDGSLDYFR